MIMDLLEARNTSVVQSVRGVIQIVNDGPVPTIPRNYSELRDWYSENSQVLVPTTRITALESGRFARRQGTFVGIDEGDDLASFVRSALPKIEEFVKIKLTGDPQ